MTGTQNTATATTTLPLSALQPNDYNPNQMADERFAEQLEKGLRDEALRTAITKLFDADKDSKKTTP